MSKLLTCVPAVHIGNCPLTSNRRAVKRRFGKPTKCEHTYDDLFVVEYETILTQFVFGDKNSCMLFAVTEYPNLAFWGQSLIGEKVELVCDCFRSNGHSIIENNQITSISRTIEFGCDCALTFVHDKLTSVVLLNPELQG